MGQKVSATAPLKLILAGSTHSVSLPGFSMHPQSHRAPRMGHGTTQIVFEQKMFYRHLSCFSSQRLPPFPKFPPRGTVNKALKETQQRKLRCRESLNVTQWKTYLRNDLLVLYTLATMPTHTWTAVPLSCRSSPPEPFCFSSAQTKISRQTALTPLSHFAAR